MTHPHPITTPVSASLSRRDFLARAGCGFGTLALAGLLDGEEGGCLAESSRRG